MKLVWDNIKNNILMTQMKDKEQIILIKKYRWLLWTCNILGGVGLILLIANRKYIPEALELILG